MPASSPELPAPFVCQYSRPKVGKTTTAGLAFPMALFIGKPGAIVPRLRKAGGFDPTAQIRDVSRFSEATALIPQAKKIGLTAVVIDDGSHLAETTEQIIKSVKRKNRYDYFNLLMAELIEFRDVARDAGLPIVFNAWVRAGQEKKGRWLAGGPMLPYELPERFPALADLVLWGTIGEDRFGPHKAIYRCELDSGYIMGNRGAPAGMPSQLPMNLGEVLRFCGWKVPRHPGLPWQEEMVEKIAGLLLEADNAAARADIGREVYAALEGKGYKEVHIDWTIQDALDRMTLRKSQRRGPALFGW